MMSNNTLHKYQRLYSINRRFNDEFDVWVKENYSVTVGKESWNWGVETFHNSSGELLVDAVVMQEYVRAGGRFYATDIDCFEGKLSKGVRNVPKY